MGFAIAEREWFNSGSVVGYLLDLFHSADALNSSLFDGKSLARDLERCFKEGFSWGDTTRIWEVLNIYLWHKQFVETCNLEVA